MTPRTMQSLSYGITNPSDLLDKLKYDGQELEKEWHPYSVFNFLLTASSLHEWIIKFYDQKIEPAIKIALNKCDDFNLLPHETESWIKDTSCLPNSGWDTRKQVQDSILICRHVANGSKHFNWASKKNSKVFSIDKEPLINDFYKWFFTKVGPGVFIEYDGVYYCISQIRDILSQFYEGLIDSLEKK